MFKGFNSEKVKNIFWFGIASLIFAGLVLLADLNKLITALTEAKLIYMIFSCAAGFSIILAWTLNWFNFFKVSKINCSFPRTFQLFSAGQFINSITPLGQFGGQPFMAYLISTHSDTSYEESLATVMSADVLAIMPLSTFVIIGYSYITITGTVSGELTRMALIASSLLIFGIVMSYLGWYRPGSLENTLLKVTEGITNFIGRGSSFVDKLEEKLENVEETFKTVGEHPKAVIRSLAITHTAFLLKMTAFYGVMLSVGLEMNPFQVMLLIPLASVANFSPTPGGAGTFEAAMAGLIVLFVDVNLATALTAAILYRLATYWVNIIVGYIAMSSLNYDIGDIGNTQKT
ncbi:MAG: lysylphosphatidylglycerol synthase transmembrane domain-containing protein [Candidatus Nanohaloarchaea archaeon]